MRTLHPDVAGAQSTSAFQKAAEAYAVLADPGARRRHDAELAAWDERRPVPEPASVAPWRWDPEALTFEVILTPDEAVRGVDLPIGLPAVDWCGECGGAERVWLVPCTSCGGRGVVAAERVVRIQIPPQDRPGSVIEMPLHGVGIHNLYLRLHVRIE